MFGEIFWRNKTATSLTFCLSISFISMIWQGNILSRGVGSIGRLGDRLSGALNSGLRFTGTLWVELDRYRELEKRHAAAQKRLEEYRLEKDKFDALRAENDRLRRQAGYHLRSDYRELQAEVLGIRINSISPRLIIGKGSADGVQPYMPVIARAHDKEQNLIRAAVGMVIAVDEHSAVVQPLTHSAFRLGVRMGEQGRWAILSGNSGNIAHALLTYISDEAEANKVTISRFEGDLKPGTPIITSGGGGLFPAGIPVGTILKEGSRLDQFRTAIVVPYAPIYNLDDVTIILITPKPWSEVAQQKRKTWDEHLTTPFGNVDYTGLPVFRVDPPKREQKADTKTAAKGEPDAKTESKTEGKTEAKTGPGNKTGTDPGRKRRRLRNLEGP